MWNYMFCPLSLSVMLIVVVSFSYIPIYKPSFHAGTWYYVLGLFLKLRLCEILDEICSVMKEEQS